jgi:DNA-directed RNA polymerase specialized sigma24 family protein
MSRDEEDKYLLDCVLEAQKHPPASPERRKALDRFVLALTNSQRLYRPSMGRIPSQCQGGYQDICNDAQQSLMLYVCKNIDKYDSTKASVMGWLNMLMDRRFIVEGIKQFQDGRERRLGKRRLSDLDQAEVEIPAPQDENPEYAEFRRFVNEDPKGLLQSKKLRDRPDITFQTLLQWRLEDRTWDDIATEFGLSLQTLHSFFRRSLKSLSPDLREQLSF